MPRRPDHRRPALGGALGPTREDAQASQEVVFEYSQQLNQQVVALESENLELLDGKRAVETTLKSLSERVALLEKENNELRDAGFATFQERNHAVHHAQNVMQSKQGEVNLLRHTADQIRQREGVLATNNARLSGIAERLQGERSQLQRQVMSLEATTCGMQAEIAQQANNEAQAALANRDLDRQVNSLSVQKMRLDQEMGVRHVEVAHLRHTREELLDERDATRQLREGLSELEQDKLQMREEMRKQGETISTLHIEVAHMQGANDNVQADGARLHDALSREGSMGAGLRRRVTELEDLAGELRRANMSLEGENGALRSALTRARAEADMIMEASNKLVHEKGGVEHLADEQSNRRIELERLLATSTDECKRVLKHRDQLQADNQELQRKSAQLEADNVVLGGQLKGQGVMLRGLQGDYIDDSIRTQWGMGRPPGQGRVRTPSPPRGPMPPQASSPMPAQAFAFRQGVGGPAAMMPPGSAPGMAAAAAVMQAGMAGPPVMLSDAGLPLGWAATAQVRPGNVGGGPAVPGMSAVGPLGAAPNAANFQGASAQPLPGPHVPGRGNYGVNFGPPTAPGAAASWGRTPNR